MDDTRPALLPKTVRLLGSSLVCLQARSVRCEPDEVDEQKARRRIRRYVENFLRVQRSLAMQIALRSVKILMHSLVSLVISCGYVHDHHGFIEDAPSGTEASESKLWPQVVLVYGDSICTGVIVQHNYVLTAAHCSDSNTSLAVYHHDGPKLGEASEHYAPQDNDPDIALLKFSDQTFSIPPLSLGFDTAKNDM